MAKNKKIFISTAIDYVNSVPHIGHALEKLQADVLARYHRILGDEVFFLSGTDDNSLKNVLVAKKQGVSTRKLVDTNSQKFYALKNALNLSYDDFIRTTEQRHIKGAQKLWGRCKKDIYKKNYKGLYCVGCEQFYKENELVKGCCAEHKTKPEMIEEENYFFKLTKYQDKLKKIIESDKIKIIPKTRKNEVLSFINQGLEDICISRSAERAQGWGIDAPDDKTQKIWVWMDALSNYINALGYAKNTKKFQNFWSKQGEILHIIGKGILRFHAIYWPAFLFSANLPLPRTIFVHGYINSKGQKMSKSLGNVINPFELVEKYGTDPVRYYLLREISSTEDGDFTQEKFEERYNADLANGLGNLVARVVTLAKIFNFQLTPQCHSEPQRRIPRKGLVVIPRDPSLSLRMTEEGFRMTVFQTATNKTWKNYKRALDNFKFNEALAEIWTLISFCDKMIDKERPWEKSKNQLSIINDLLFALSNIAQMLEPFLPDTSEKILRQLKQGKSKPLFPRISHII